MAVGSIQPGMLRLGCYVDVKPTTNETSFFLFSS
jgi:hypothetical protein